MAVSKRLRYEILRRDQYTCRYCGATAPDAPLRVDHVVPVALGGTDHPSNLATSCEPCNNGKSSTIEGFVAEADVPSARSTLSAALADEVVQLWTDAYKVNHVGEPSLTQINQVREATRDAYRYGTEPDRLMQSATYCGLIGETYIGLGGGTFNQGVLALIAEATRIWRDAWRRASNFTEWPDMDAVFMFELSVEYAVDAGADRMTIIRAASTAGWVRCPLLERVSGEIAALVGDL